MSDSTNNGNDDAATRALREGLRAPKLSAEALQRIREAAQQEWRLQTRPVKSPGRRRLALAAAATVATFAVAIGWNVFMDSAPDVGVLGQLARVEAPGIVEARRLRADIALTPGASLHTGQTFDVRGDSLVTLAGGGNLRVARASVIEVVAANAVKLERGEIYIDIPPGSRGGDKFIVVTPAGEFRHVGTQFAVAIVNGLTRLRVREGSVLWHATEGDSTVNAGTEVTIDRTRTVTRRPIGTTGRDWSWAESMAPDIEIENRPLQEFLLWFSRETGRKLVLADDAVRKQAATIRMHGSVRGLTAMEALTAVMAATTLRFELPEGMIRVSSARESTAPPT
ncbi:MAG TPA: FecR domain-containing protein [Steroidobacteraceae bacterium]|jgi:ferric-dicitrate binding protein FerR (iron transport regulator)|nr:FecR domain-containing protein [Steroidobacteraceae bacterium]